METITKPEILIVDDEVFVLKSLIRTLRQEGYRVTAVNTAARALQKMEQTEFNLVICDLKMPDIDGIEFLTLVSEVSPNTTQVLLSGHADLRDLQEAINRCNVTQFVAKPWDATELRTLTRQLVDESLYNTEIA